MRFEKWQALGNDYAIVEESAHRNGSGGFASLTSGSGPTESC